MFRSATRLLSLLVVSGALAIGAAAPAQAFTPPIGSDKGSITEVNTSKYYDMSSPYLKSEPGPAPDANGIIAILIG
jgi:hypothetical protein